MENIYAVNDAKPTKDIHDTLDKCSTHLFYLTAALFALYSFCGLEFFISAMIITKLSGQDEPILPIYIPFIDFNTPDGHFITTMYHCVVIFLASIGLAFIDALFFNLVFNILTMSKLQCNQLAILNDELAQPKPPTTLITIRLINIFKMNQEMQK